VGDGSLLEQVFSNLLSNALKFTAARPHSHIEIGTARGPAEQIYFIKDNGVGFDMKYADRLFGVFQRLHSQSEFEGTGIGLSIVHRIVRRHGGRTWAESVPQEGATFYFSLPQTAAAGM
jgi:light-regulated signal transduction histidine kinase (bacteriophytochrome)